MVDPASDLAYDDIFKSTLVLKVKCHMQARFQPLCDVLIFRMFVALLNWQYQVMMMMMMMMMTIEFVTQEECQLYHGTASDSVTKLLAPPCYSWHCRANMRIETA